MHEKNTIAKDYLSSPERFAQLFNIALFQGQTIIEPDKLAELDPSENVFLYPAADNTDENITISTKALFHKETYRDILKVYNDSALMIICGIENQDRVHYAMPVRNLLYDALQYHDQWQNCKNMHDKAKDLKGAEFLSGFAKEDRLIPVFTLCVYWGTEPWDGPRNLQEMLDIPTEPEQYRDRIGNYTLNILEINAIDNLELFQSIDSETVLAMSVLGNAQQLRKCLKEAETINSKQNPKEGGIDVCQALEDMINDGKKEGGIRTLIEDNLEENIPESRILEKLQKRFRLTADEAANYLKQYRK